jgi:hypothetical protein
MAVLTQAASPRSEPPPDPDPGGGLVVVIVGLPLPDPVELVPEPEPEPVPEPLPGPVFPPPVVVLFPKTEGASLPPQPPRRHAPATDNNQIVEAPANRMVLSSYSYVIAPKGDKIR